MKEPWPFLAEKRAMPTKVRARLIYAKGPDRCRGMPHSLPGEVWGRSDGCGSSFPACDLRFGAEPVFLLVTVLSAARLIEFVRTLICLSSSSSSGSLVTAVGDF